MNRLIIVGSPRVDGRSAHLANMLFESCIEECPDDELALAPVSTLAIEGCTGCDSCREIVGRAELSGAEDGAFPGKPGKKTGEGDDAGEAEVYPCVIDDDMLELYELIDAADELIVVSPVYFSGPPAQLKALLDRLQPYYWRGARAAVKRPCVLHVVGEGGDPHGFDALISIVRSALAVAGFKLETVFDWVGKIDESGEIVADATEMALGEGAPILSFDQSKGAHVADCAGGKPSTDDALSSEDASRESAPEAKSEPKPGASWGERGSARKRLSLDDAAKSSSGAGSSRVGAMPSRGGGQAGKKQASRPSVAAHGKGASGSKGTAAHGKGAKGASSSRSRKGGSKGGKRRG